MGNGIDCKACGGLEQEDQVGSRMEEGKRERTWGERAKIKSHLKGSMKT